jgi:hypothetical protein
MDEPKYSGPNRCGVCVCGHSWEDHHLGVVMNAEYAEATGEAYLPEECEFYGFNEMGGLDAEGNNHCQKYVDQNAPKTEKP